MNKIKNSFNEAFDNIKLSNKASNDLNIRIMAGYKKRKNNKKISLFVLIIINIMLISTGITYAEEIKGNLNVLVSKIIHKDTSMNKNGYTLRLESNIRKELNFNAKLNEPTCVNKMDKIYGIRDSKCYSAYSPNELNEFLGIKILNSDKSKLKDYILYKSIRDENNNIQHLDFRISNIFQIMPEKGNKFQNQEGLIVSIRAIILTKYYTDNDIYWDYSVDINAASQEYYINNLNTKAYITDYPEDKGELLGNERKIVLFVYDDIVYRLDITSLYNRNETTNNIYSLLESLTY